MPNSEFELLLMVADTPRLTDDDLEDMYQMAIKKGGGERVDGCLPEKISLSDKIGVRNHHSKKRLFKQARKKVLVNTLLERIRNEVSKVANY